MRIPLRAALAAAVTASALACQSEQAGFNTPAPARKPGDAGVEGTKPASDVDSAAQVADAHLFEAPCKDNGAASDLLEVEHKGSLADTFQVKAQWCIKAKQVGRLRLMFLVDHSGSMRLNDPEQNGTCGRLAAATALIDKIKSTMSEADDVQIAAVTFGTQAHPAADFTPLSQFASKLNAQVFCQAVDKTNYLEAFKVAQDLIRASADADAPVTAYLLSDGLPSVGTEQSPEDFLATEAAALQGAESLRSGDKVTLNAIYLKGDEIPGQTPPEQYLAGITGSADRVRLANDASSLAASITSIELPVPAIDPATASATVEGKDKDGGVVSETLKVESVTQDAGDSGKLTALTAPFKLPKAAHSGAKRFVVKLKVDVGDGTTRQTSVVVNVKP